MDEDLLEIECETAESGDALRTVSGFGSKKIKRILSQIIVMFKCIYAWTIIGPLLFVSEFSRQILWAFFTDGVFNGQ